MEEKMTFADFQQMFQKDADGCYVNLTVPAFDGFPEYNLTGKRPEAYSLEEIIQLKKYAGKMFKLVDQSTM